MQNFAQWLAGEQLRGEGVREERISKGLVFPFVWRWRKGSSSREGHDLRHPDGRPDSGIWSGTTKLHSLDGDDDKEAEGEEGQDGSDDD
jgi:hypothetical protein